MKKQIRQISVRNSDGVTLEKYNYPRSIKAVPEINFEQPGHDVAIKCFNCGDEADVWSEIFERMFFS